MLPVRSTQLSPGEVQRRVIRAPGLTALFLIGDDERSRAWLRQRQAALRELQAVGLVVNVESMAALTALRRLAPGLILSRSEEHTSELQSLMRISYAVFCLKKKKKNKI